jgi:RhtB (resistance to homoserine/threonine) family protein
MPACDAAGMVLLTFLVVSLVVICTPGPDTALTIRNSLTGGRRGGVATAAGVSGGQLVWTVASVVGLAALLQTSQVLLEWLRLLGAGYLIYLGLRSLVSAWRSAGSEVDRAVPVRQSSGAAFRQGVISNLANPKMVAFFLSLLPQFVLPGVPPVIGFLLLGLLFCLLTFGWLSLYAVLLHRAQALFRRSNVRRAVEGLTGAVLVGLGVRLAAERA